MTLASSCCPSGRAMDGGLVELPPQFWALARRHLQQPKIYSKFTVRMCAKPVCSSVSSVLCPSRTRANYSCGPPCVCVVCARLCSALLRVARKIVGLSSRLNFLCEKYASITSDGTVIFETCDIKAFARSFSADFPEGCVESAVRTLVGSPLVRKQWHNDLKAFCLDAVPLVCEHLGILLPMPAWQTMRQGPVAASCLICPVPFSQPCKPVDSRGRRSKTSIALAIALVFPVSGKEAKRATNQVELPVSYQALYNACGAEPKLWAHAAL